MAGMDRPRARTFGPLLVALALLAGCTGQPGRAVPATKRQATPAPRASQPPAAVGDPLAKALDGVERRSVGGAGPLVQTRLAGTARLISDRGGAIISDNGGGIISNNSGAIISDNGGGLVANNGGGLVSNNGGGLTSKAKYAVRQAPPTAEFRLADAVVTVHDAAGRALVDAAGKPITATTDAAGAYRLEAALPAENLVVRIRLWQGGTLSAMLPKGEAARTIDLDTASSIGAAYVLGEYVRGDQAVYDKLPATEADRLGQGLRAAQALVTTAPRYEAAELVAIGEDLRKRDGAVDKTLTDITALLLGQANLGAGRRADEVPLAAPEALVVDGRGRLLIGEAGFGRVRAVAPDGTMTTWVDTAFGEVKRNFYELSELALGPDGRVYVFAKGALWAVGADGQVAELPLPPGVGSIRTGLAVGADGTAYVGHAARQRITAVPPQGPAREVPLDGPGRMWGMKAAPDGRLYALCGADDGQGEVWRGTADGVRERVASGFAVANDSDLEIAADGTLYVSTYSPAALLAIAPDGTRRVLAGADAAEPDGRALVKPSTLHLAKDGTLYVADKATAFVHARTAAGAWRRVAGSHARIQDLARGEVSVNGPGGAAFDAQGRLVFTEVASHSVKRFDGQRIETLAGTVRGFSGDGGPATAARLSLPRSVATSGDDVYVLDTDNGRLRRIGADGTIATVAGDGDEEHVDLAPGQDHPAGTFPIGLASGLAIGGDGRPVWTTRHQVVRLAADGSARVLAGKPFEDATKLFDLATLLGAAFPIAAADAPFAIAAGIAADPVGAVHVSDAGRGQVFRVGDAQVGPVFGISLVDQLANAGTHHVLPAEAPDAKELAAIVPAGVCFDPQGNLYVAEMGTRQLTSASTALGSEFPFDAAAVGVYPARVRKITPEGRVTTIAGPGGRFYTDPDAEDALVLPSGLAFAKDGRLAILDAGANSIRILPAGSF